MDARRKLPPPPLKDMEQDLDNVNLLAFLRHVRCKHSKRLGPMFLQPYHGETRFPHTGCSHYT